MFWGCQSLKTLPGISKLNIKNIKDLNSIFFSCKSLKLVREKEFSDVRKNWYKV